MTAPLDLAGIGAGPFNLAVAALLHRQPVNARFFEAKTQHSWHPGMMLPQALLQTSYLKDLVTPVDPTNPYSFLAYLVERRRFYAFVNAEQEAISRQEFADYLAWVATRLPSVQMNSAVESVEDTGEHFRLRVAGQDVLSRNLCVAAGKRPYVPECCTAHLSSQCFHALGIAEQDVDVRGKRVAVIGGGQTGAEIVLHLLDNTWGRPAAVNWVSRRSNFLPLDETPFTNDWFTPDYARDFQQLPQGRREQLLAEQKLASDGISPVTLKALYQRMYRLTHVDEQGPDLALLPKRSLIAMRYTGHYGLSLHNSLVDQDEFVQADMVILCTGLSDAVPACMVPLLDQLECDEAGRPCLDGAFGTDWPGAGQRRIYLLNMARHSHGIAEPNLSLSAWRAACVVNDLVGRACYDTGQAPGPMQWTTRTTQQQAVA